MIDRIIQYSIEHKLIIGMLIIGLIGWGTYSLRQLPIDAVPDITNNQVQILTVSPNLAAPEVEAFISFPVEQAMQNLPGIEEIRSISRFGLSVVTVVFHDDMGTYLPRQLVQEQLAKVTGEIPPEMGKPELSPISTGLGEILQYVIHPTPESPKKYSPMELRTIQDWIVRRQMAGIEGVVEVNSFGGYLKEYEVSIDPAKLNSLNLSMEQVFRAVESGNGNIGGAYIEKGASAYYIRGEGMVKSLEDIREIVIEIRGGVPLTVGQAADVGFGHAPRFGAMTRNGNGEVVGGIVMMLKGANSAQVISRVKERVAIIQKSLPEGLVIEPYLDRSVLVEKTVKTVAKNLIEGGLIVIFVLVLLLGNFRAGLVVASVIPLAMLFAFSMMHLFGVSANLMSLGAIDFGLIVDGAVIIVEAIVHRLQTTSSGVRLTQKQMNTEVLSASVRIRKSAAFGEIIILVVYLPILTLSGIEGKMFKPMAQTVGFAIVGALILSLTYVPMMASWALSKKVKAGSSFADRLIAGLQRVYAPVLAFALRMRVWVAGASLVIFLLALLTFSRLGGEFIPTLEEGDFALHQILPAGSSLSESIEVSTKLQKMLLKEFPEIKEIVTKIGTAEIPTDPMSVETGDIMVIMKDKSEWTSGKTKEELFAKMEKVMSRLPGIEYEFTQPIQMRFNELMTGVRQDIAIKIFGEDLDVLSQKAQEAKALLAGMEGVGDVQVERQTGLPQINVAYQRDKLAQYGLRVSDLNFLIESGFAGKIAGVVLEGEKRFNLTVRLDTAHRTGLADVRNLLVDLPGGGKIPLHDVAEVKIIEAPMQVSREDAKRRITIGINARNRDTESLVKEIQLVLDQGLTLPPGYFLEYGGQFENLRAARARLSIAVPIALLLIFLLLYLTFHSIPQALLIFSAIPLSAIGGIWALYLRGMPFSISAGVGFIALFGVSVLNGIVLIGSFNQLKEEGMTDVFERIKEGTKQRLRPVIMTAAVASLGFLPMALSNSAGTEVQKPLATVVIGGLLTATLLTLLVLPALYALFNREKKRGIKGKSALILLIGMLGMTQLQAQMLDFHVYGLEIFLERAEEQFPDVKLARAGVERAEALKKGIFTLPATQFSLSFGQMNTEEVDRYFSVSQGFSFPSQYLAKKAVYEQEMAAAGLKEEWDLMNFRYEMLQLWLESVWRKERYELVTRQYRVVDSLKDWTKSRLEAGTISGLENELVEYNWKREKAKYNIEYLAYTRTAKRLGMFVEDDLVLAYEDSLKQLEREWGFMNESGERIPEVNWLEAQSAVAESQIKTANSLRTPTFSLGYFNQQIDGQPGFQGVTMGIGIPLFPGESRQNVAIAEANHRESIAQVESVRWRRTNRLQELDLAASSLRHIIKIQSEVTESPKISALIMNAWKAGETDLQQWFIYVEKEISLELEIVDAWYTLMQIRLEQAFIRGKL